MRCVARVLIRVFQQPADFWEAPKNHTFCLEIRSLRAPATRKFDRRRHNFVRDDVVKRPLGCWVHVGRSDQGRLSGHDFGRDVMLVWAFPNPFHSQRTPVRAP